MTNQTAWEVDLSLVNGMMVGIEFPPVVESGEEDMLFACMIDLFIIRIVFIKWQVV